MEKREKSVTFFNEFLVEYLQHLKCISKQNKHTTMQSSYQILQNIRRLREFRNMNQEQLADLLELSTRGYRNLETGEANLSLERFLAIAKALSVTPVTLLTLHQMDTALPPTFQQPEIDIIKEDPPKPGQDTMMEALKTQLAYLKREIDTLKLAPRVSR